MIFPPSESEIRRFSDGREVRELARIPEISRDFWLHIERPSFSNPQLDVLSTVETKLVTLEEFRQSHDLPGPLVAEMDMHKASLSRAAAYLNQLSHDVAFVETSPLERRLRFVLFPG